MLRIHIKPTTFDIFPLQDGQNKYINRVVHVNKKKALEQHKNLVKSFKNSITYTIEDPIDLIPDIVFTANGGLCLPRLPKPLIVLPYMKYQQRKDELKYLEEIYKNIHVETVPFPGNQSAPFEGQAELKWFYGGTKAICGYGYRSTKKSFEIINTLFKKIYKSHKLEPPELLVVKLESPDYYHLDVAMLDFHDKKCIVHKKAFSEASVKKMQAFLGEENVTVIDTPDNFCLNAVVEGDTLVTHMLKAPLKSQLENITNKKIHMVDTSEFQKSGGSVRCMTLNIFTDCAP
jgi:N-dimethylarginine dimethylaminohydrolase